ncbi:hypothetical protein [Methylobacterium sp. J-077]|uniref:hypothetical protein n=1 Tax=Methylobacterium sp. J-077 TaxID=2836656 RepID=UPI001FBBEC29|nr:hypothetical protein [Methylobacterium sp. J-077]MCJ2125026.1 hypothetical protein [Methylobacterium sp. J-077]
MTKSYPERPSDETTSSPAASLSPSIRRHLGQTLRAVYADALAAPIDQRLEALVKQLGKPKP